MIGGTIFITEHQIEDIATFHEPTKWKALKINKEDRVNLDEMFDAAELQTFASFDDDLRLYSAHIDMAWWLISRDFAGVDAFKLIAFLSPDFISAALYGMKATDADTDPAVELLRAVANIKAKIKDKILVLVAVWGGTSDGDSHWTQMAIEMVAKPKGDIEVRYRDSLTSESNGCRQHAKEILILIQMAVDYNKDMAVPPRCNFAMQPVGEPVCGHYTCHWLRSEVHVFCKEGHAAGYPDWLTWKTKIEMIQNGIVKNKGVKDMHKVVLEKIKFNKDQEKKAMQAITDAIMEDHQEQMNAAAKAQIWIQESFAMIGGCSKCAQARYGCPTCNPDKITAKNQAEEQRAIDEGWEKPKDNQYDKKIYKQIYDKILTDRAQMMTSDCKPLKKTDKGGGSRMVGIVSFMQCL